MMSMQFDKEIQRLIRFYGDKAYGEERKVLLWQEFRGTEIEVFTMAIDQAIRDNRYPPLAKEIQKAISFIRERKWGKEKDKENTEAKDGPRYRREPSKRFKQILKTFRENFGKVEDDKSFAANTALALESETKIKDGED